MSVPIITQGATTSHGGNVTECDPTFKIDGKNVHLDGMTHYCPKCKKTVSAIASNHTKKVNGKAVVLDGDKTSCGATFIANQSMGFISGGFLSNSNEEEKNQDNHTDGEKYYLQYIIQDKKGNPIADADCIVFKPSGENELYHTDSEGKISILTDDKSQTYEIHVIQNSQESLENIQTESEMQDG